MYLKEDSAVKRGKYEHPAGAYPGYPPAAAPSAAPYYPPAGPPAAAPPVNRQYVSGMAKPCRQHLSELPTQPHVCKQGEMIAYH